jgi:outer membrane protein TolC
LQQNELALQQQKLDWQNSFALLNYLCGIVDDNFTHLSPPDFQELSQPKSFDETVYAQAFDADKLKIENDKAVLLYNYKPKVSVFSDAGYQSSFALTPYKNFGLGLGVGVSIPIYDGHQKKMLLQQNDLALQTRQTYRNQQEKQYQQLLLQLQNQLEQYQKMLTLAEQQLTYSKTLVEANAKQLPTGDVKTVDFILSISNYLGLKANIIQYQENILLLQNQLHYLILP